MPENRDKEKVIVTVTAYFFIVLMILTIICIALLVFLNEAKGYNQGVKDYGVHGQLFDIAERSLLEIIMARLKTAEKEGKLKQLEEEFKSRVKAKIMRPAAVTGINKATRDRSWTYDPTFTQKEAILDDKGKVIIPAGTSVNPLDELSWGEPIILIDGDDKEQVNWAKNKAGKLTLVKGAPIDLAAKLGREIYFDQGGILCKRFNIETVPAIIEQNGSLLKIREIEI